MSMMVNSCYNFKIRKIRLLLRGLLLMMGFSLVMDGSMYVNGTQGGGGGTGGIVAGCEYNAFQKLCGTPAGSAGGGASWRIFSTNDGYGLDDWTGYGGSILQASYKSEAMTKCKNTGWFASFGWDGMVGSHYGYKNYNFQIGPANRKGLVGESGTKYNNYNAKGLATLKKEGYSNNTKIWANTAKALYQKINPNATGIPKDVGWFCIDPLDVKYTLKGIAVDLSGAELGNNPGSVTVESGKSASVTRKGITGYTFKGWRSYKTSGTPTGNGTYTVKNLTDDRTVYAVYEAKTFKSSLSIKVKNDDIAKYNNYNQSVYYAKPGNKLTFKATYNPGAQGAYKIKPQAIRIDNGKVINGDSKTIGTLFDANNGCNKNSAKCWKNAFNVTASNFNYSHNYSFNNGVDKLQEPPNNYTVTDNDVGKALKETASATKNNTVKTTPKEVSFYVDNKKKIAKISTNWGNDVSSPEVLVPYNFENEAIVETEQTNVLYAGEKTPIGYEIRVKPRPNRTIGGSSYATIVRDAEWKLEICYNGKTDCDTPIKGNGDLNTSSLPSPIGKSTNVDIRDVPAGTKVYVRSAVYPASSECGSNKDLCMDARGSNTWAYSGWKEFTIAKKPSIQIWGGNIYSSGNIVTAIANKTNLAGYSGNQKNHVFGSWGELGIISNGSISGFASGASLNFDVGSQETDFCKLSPLTFPNDGCKNGIIPGFVGNSNSNPMAIDKNAVLSKFDFSNSENKPEDASGDVGMNDETYKIGEKDNQNIYYYHNEGDISVNRGTAGKGTVQVIHAGNVTINGDLNYEDGYRNFEEMPKIVVYAENNININCGVNTIDALLIANGNVNTCSDSDDLNSKKNSNPLKINGAVIAGKLLANRTYGAATGTNSWIPAEIINFDPTLYLWGSISGSSEGDHNNNYNLDVTYHEELAPRY